ncbi:MAG: chromosomal replication initiator protein DnaA [Synergistaceae bacterium]|nr:chromosomal replication initiator protein DnaA [Synergistaceae bacterium]
MNDQLTIIWDKALGYLEKEVSPIGFETYFKAVVPVSFDENSIVLSVKEEFYKNHLNRYVELIKNCVKAVTGRGYNITIVLESDVSRNSPVAGINGANGNGGDTALNVTLLNSKYTFDTFVIGDSNKIAHAYSVAVAESTPKAYNPLFLYGETGLGKTHLMHAIGNYKLAQNPGTKVIYVTSEKFTADLINAIKDDKTAEFRLRYRMADLLLLDDVQFIGNKERTQEEFFYTFNELYNSGKHIVITSDKKPSDLPLFEDRLKSRFEWGLSADIQPPDFETRIAILRKKSQLQDLYVSDDIITYIAENIPSNIRKLEGALNRILAYASLTDYELSVNIAEEALKDIITTGANREITSNIIINAVCKYFNLRDDGFISTRKRNREIVIPRQVAMYLCRELTGMSLPSIGHLFGNRDHTTVMNSIKRVNEGIMSNNEAKRMIDSLIADIKGV